MKLPIERLRVLEARFEDLARQMAEPEVLNDPARLQEVSREYSELEPLVNAYREYRQRLAEVEELRELLEEGDPELADLAREELEEAEARLAELERTLWGLLLPKDPNDERNVVVEIRAGTGGEEAALFAADLYRMYTRYAERQGWKVELVEASESDLGGFKEVIFLIRGKGAFSRLKFERGVHRVQRVPVTESGGRIHTSTATVAVLPEMEEVEVEIRPEDLRIETFRASGHGGQHVNMTDSAVRITHLPTGIVVSSQSERSQHQNRARALAVLRARLHALEEERRRREVDEARRSQVGTGERSEKIRTYNFPQDRVTDHRIRQNFSNLPDILDGNLDRILDALTAWEQEQRLKELEAELTGTADR